MAELFTQEWADEVRHAMNNFPDDAYRETKLHLFWDWIDAARKGFDGAIALGVRDLPANGDTKTVYAKFTIEAGQYTKAEIVDGSALDDARFVLAGDYETWKDIVQGYDSGKAVMYRRLRLEKGDVFRFFNRIYFFTESLVALSKVPAALPS